MIQYIYFVKCPNCEDEPFDFFDEAKEFALGCLSSKPVITQVEVNRNDFGECVDSTNLGTVWSWEDLMSDVPAEDSALSIFTKDDFVEYNPDTDPEFADMPNTLDTVPDNFRKPNSGRFKCDVMTEKLQESVSATDYFINDLKDTYEEDVIETGDPQYDCDPMSDAYSLRIEVLKDIASQYDKVFDNLSHTICAKIDRMVENNFTYKEIIDTLIAEAQAESDSLLTLSSNSRKPVPEGMSIESLVEEMEENEDTVECKWCEELFDKSECRYEVDLGWLCDRCQAAIMSRGETLTFREGSDLTEASLTDIADAASAEFETSWNSDDILDMAGAEDPRRLDIHTGMTPSEKRKFEWEQAKEASYKNKLAAWKRHKKAKGLPEDLDDNNTVDLDGESVVTPDIDPLTETFEDEYEAKLVACPGCGVKSYDNETGMCISCGFN